MAIAQTHNRVDEMLRQTVLESQGNIITPTGTDTAGIGNSPTSETPLRWVRDGVVESAFQWGKHSFSSENVFFI